LLLGRELHSNYGSSIDGLDIPVVVLKARQPEVLGIYRRLAGWDNAPSSFLPQPSPEVLDQWVATFGGDPYLPETTTDLIAFSAAVLDRLPELMKGHWNLTEQHAVDAIRVHYLDKLKPEEANNLMRLAALSELDFSLPQEALISQFASFKTTSRRLGLVFQVKAGGYTHYRLAHTALGRLLLKASYKPVDVGKELRAVALAYPFTGFAIARRLQALGQVKQAKAVLTEMMEHPECLLELGACHYLYFAIQQISMLDVADLADLAKVFSHEDSHDRLVRMALATPLQFLKNFLAYAERTKELKPVFALLADPLADPDNRKALIGRALDTPFGDLKAFLAYADRAKELKPVFAVVAVALAHTDNRKSLIWRALASPPHSLKSFMIYAERTEELNPVFAIVATALTDKDNRKDLIGRVLASPLHFLKDFMAYAERTDVLQPVFSDMLGELADPNNRKVLILRALVSPLGDLKNFMEYVGRTKGLQPVFTDVADALAGLDNREVLIRKALATPFHFLRNFMAYADQTKELKSVFVVVAGALVDPGNRSTLIGNVLATPLDFLKDFMVYAEQTKALKAVFDVLVGELKKPENSKLLAKSFVSAPLEKLVAVLRTETAAELWQTVLEAVDTAEWQRDRLLETSPKVEAFISFYKCCVSCGKPELAVAPALNIVRHPSSQNWHTPVIGLHHLSHVLRLAVDVSTAETVRFLDVVATADWVDEQIEHGAKTGGLAGALFSLAIVLPEQQRRYFLRPALELRVRRELAAFRPGDYFVLADGISLLGAAALLGLRIETIPLTRPETMDLNTIVKLRKSLPEQTGIGPLQGQLWCGLRELSRLCSGLGAIPADEAETILKHWREADTGESGKSLPQPIRQNNAVMIAWLERCQAAGWRLIST